MTPILMTRREACLSFAAAVASPILASAQSPRPTRPNQATFQPGDFLWPKPKDGFVVFGADDSFDREKLQWSREKDDLIKALFSKPILSEHETEILQAVSNLSFEEFYAQYVEGQKEGTYQPYGSVAGFGHVAIVSKTGAVGTTIVEARPPQGVRELDYATWLQSRPNDLVYHGRLLEAPLAEREAPLLKRQEIASRALSYLNAPYNLWNFNLADDRSFYCAKLVWLCVYRVSTMPLDGNPNPMRKGWLSPKQLLQSDLVTVLFAPVSY